VKTISRIYHSREDRVAELHSDDERVQYDKGDVDRITQVMDVLGEHSDNLLDALDDYSLEASSPVDEDSDSRMAYARRELIEKWAYSQGALSKVAWALRFDGNVAFERLINAIKNGETIDMRGL
jgi:hypothetical protein